MFIQYFVFFSSFSLPSFFQFYFLSSLFSDIVKSRFPLPLEIVNNSSERVQWVTPGAGLVCSFCVKDGTIKRITWCHILRSLV